MPFQLTSPSATSRHRGDDAVLGVSHAGLGCAAKEETARQLLAGLSFAAVYGWVNRWCWVIWSGQKSTGRGRWVDVVESAGDGDGKRARLCFGFLIWGQKQQLERQRRICDAMGDGLWPDELAVENFVFAG
ncbi:hypothetical protein M0R45_035913 [Rubus argutus]|uniref:Uncharacterized protein n=1 Tax=Rubus argutus TaxID=59490 RepID=A0AAW1VUI3_RUBAR